ncbi:MAG: glycoside hydrolase family 2 TIM barrel-domain containing protein [Vitreoscilla sp.]
MHVQWLVLGLRGALRTWAASRGRRRLAPLLLLFAATAGWAAPPAGRQVELLQGSWRFLREDVPAASAEDFDDSGWAAVTLPHTWNGVDGEAGGDYYRGPGWYRRELSLPAMPASAAAPQRFLQFDGAALVADVWVNGHPVGRHEGGYGAFRVDIGSWLHAGRNVIAVRVDNAHASQVAPLGGDFTVFGGLYRPVELITVNPLHVDLLDDGGPGVYVAASDIAPQRAVLAAQLRLSVPAGARAPLFLRWTLVDARGRRVVRATLPVAAAAARAGAVTQTLIVPHPHLWQGVDDPYLYRLRVQVLDRHVVADQVEVPVGIRAFSIDPARGLLLNGRPYAVHGVDLFHSGRPGKGLAVTDAQVDEDFAALGELGVTGLRLVHFQHPQRAYDDADRLGFVLWSEIPLNSAMDDSPAFRANLFQQLRELVKQNYNHPSVLVWGLGNEVYKSDAASHALLAALQREAKALDPHRVTSYAHCCAADDDALARQTDVIAFNRYYGWYDGVLADIGGWADRVHAAQPTRAIAVSEYGAGASVLQQEEPPRRPVPASHWHPEQYQALFHEAYWRQLRVRPWLWATFVWVGFDLPSAGRDEGDRRGVNDKGLATYDRQTRKDAWYWYQANWSRKPMLHLANRRAPPRAGAPSNVKVYTNLDEVTLLVDGRSLGSRPAEDHVALWEDVELSPGVHRLTAKGAGDASDSIEWKVAAPE